VEYEIVFARPALRDLEQIRAYIARDNSSAAEAFILKLLDQAQLLSTFPERGGFVRERQGTRFIMVHPYLVVYRIVAESHSVHVLRFWHGARERIRMRL
jgi:addiction module RelE/StbE family toxin